MKFKKNFKKGFTLVELIVVIAIVAILAAVSVVSYIAFINSANESADIQLVKQLNIALQADQTLHDVRSTPTEMLAAMEGNGFIIENLTKTKSGYDIVWDQKNNRFALLKGEDPIYAESSFKNQTNQQRSQITKLIDNEDELDDAQNNHYSLYLTKDFGSVSSLEISTGLDVGQNHVNQITYLNDSEQKAIIRTNGGALTVNGEYDHVEHYGVATTVDIVAVSNTTYVEHGTVGKLIVKENAKNVEVKSDAIVIELDKQTANTTVDVSGYVGVLTPGSQPISSGELGGNTIKVYTADQLQGLALSSSLGSADGFVNGKTILLENDIDLTGRTWTPFGFSAANAFYGVIDGQEHSIIGLSNGDYVNDEFYVTSSNTAIKAFGFIGLAKDNVTVKNLNLDVKINWNAGGVGGVIAMYDITKFTPNQGADPAEYTCLIQNVKVTGEIVAGDKSGGFMSGMYSGLGTAIAQNGNKFIQKVIFKDCTNEANVVGAEGSRVAGFIGASNTGGPQGEFALGSYGGSGKLYVTASIEFDHCFNKGKISFEGKKVGGFICQASQQGGQASAYITFKNNCENTGVLEGSTKGNLIAYNNGSDKKIISVNGETVELAKDASLN